MCVIFHSSVVEVFSGKQLLHIEDIWFHLHQATPTLTKIKTFTFGRFLANDTLLWI